MVDNYAWSLQIRYCEVLLYVYIYIIYVLSTPVGFLYHYFHQSFSNLFSLFPTNASGFFLHILSFLLLLLLLLLIFPHLVRWRAMSRFLH